MNTGNSSDTSPVSFIYAFIVSSLSFNLHFTREWYIIYMQDCPQTAAPCNIVGILKISVSWSCLKQFYAADGTLWSDGKPVFKSLKMMYDCK